MIRTSIPLLLPVQELRSVLVTDIIRYSTVIVSNANQKDNYSALYAHYLLQNPLFGIRKKKM